MASKVGQLKPFMIEENKEGPTRSVSKTTANKWQGSILANIKKSCKKEEKWVTLLDKVWSPKKTPNCGFPDTDTTNAMQVDLLLEYVSQYAPNALYKRSLNVQRVSRLSGSLSGTGLDSNPQATSSILTTQ